MKKLSFASQAARLIAAASLACMMGTVGCSTDRMPGAGEPQRYGPSVGPAMPSSTPGTEQSRPVNPPMISSYTAPRSVVMPRAVNTDALAVLAADQGFRGRYLGPADPGGVASYVANPGVVYQTGALQYPALAANPEITVNSSISSSPTPVVTSGGGGFVGSSGGGVAVTAPAGTSAALTAGIVTPTTAATTLTPTTAANTLATSATNGTFSSAANAPAAVINNRGGLLTPTMTSAATPSPTIAANPGVLARGAAVVTTPATATNTVTTMGTATGSLVVGRNANGTVTITNVPAVTDRSTTPPQPGLRFH